MMKIGRSQEYVIQGMWINNSIYPNITNFGKNNQYNNVYNYAKYRNLTLILQLIFWLWFIPILSLLYTEYRPTDHSISL